MIRPEVLDALLAAGATAEMIVAAVKADARQEDARIEAKRAADAARQRKSRASHGVTVTLRDAPDAPPNDIYSNPPGKPGETIVSPPPFAETFVSEWNAKAAANGARKATKLDTARKALLAARVRDHGEAGVLTAIVNLGRSRFHCGENDRGWRADAGWLLKAGNCLKAIEMAEPRDAAKPAPRQWTDAEKREYSERHLARAEGLAALPERPPRPPGQTRGPAAIGSLIANIAPH